MKAIKLFAFTTAIILSVLPMLSCYTPYRKVKGNYIQVDADCKMLEKYQDETGEFEYHLIVDGTSIDYRNHKNVKFANYGFRASVANSVILQSAGIEDKVKPGVRVTFMSAPRFFGDGDVYPLVMLSVNGEVLLDFETGFANVQ